jgi:PilZN1 domain-containing protein/PilZ domain-containing protein
MTPNRQKYEQFFQATDLVTVGIHLADDSFLEDSATILSLEGDLVLLELYGRGLPPQLAAQAGAPVIVTSREGWALYRCEAALAESITGREIKLRFVGKVEVKQRREFFRMDVTIPVYYTLPSDQQLSTVLKEWGLRQQQSQNALPPEVDFIEESFKVIDWDGGKEVEPARVNLSGGGLRFKVRDSLAYGAMLHLDIFLPVLPLRVIQAVGSVVRSKELLLSMDRYSYFSTAMAFKFIDTRDREAIISYIFNEQRNRLRQGGIRRG